MIIALLNYQGLIPYSSEELAQFWKCNENCSFKILKIVHLLFIFNPYIQVNSFETDVK